jgi:CRISPR system Cascade subunit CasA
MLPRYSLLDQPWLPVRRQSGQVEHIRPYDITTGLIEDPIVSFEWPRADLDAASREFLIGLLSTACSSTVVDPDAWEAWWEEPPNSETLQGAFAPFAPAFIFDGGGPRFMQDLDPLEEGEHVDVAALLIESPGANTLKRNGDLFVKRGRVLSLARGSAAMALYALQTFAPSGGAGHRTSLRGGGPLTTLVVPNGPVPARPPALWHLLWANVHWQNKWPDPSADMKTVFPWLAPTRVSDTGQTTTPKDVHPAQAFWGMPRRIRLQFAVNEVGEPCSLTGDVDEVTVRSYRTRPHGHNYEAWSRTHPLTPYYRTKPMSTEWLPVHPQPGHLGYRDWVGLVVSSDADDASATRMPAEVVREAQDRLDNIGHRSAIRLLASGFDMDNMKARGFVESQMPLHLFPKKNHLRDHAEALIRNLVLAARVAADALGYQVGRAIAPRDAPGADKGDRALAAARFWDQSEPAFFRLLNEMTGRLAPVVSDQDRREPALQEIGRKWLGVLRQIAFSIFDDLIPLDTLDFGSLEKRINARGELVTTFNGRNKSGAELFKTLRQPVPVRGKKTKEETAS